MCAKDNFLLQEVKDATRGLSTVILILSNKKELAVNMKVIGCLEGSDHNVIEGRLKNSKTMTSKGQFLTDSEK